MITTISDLKKSFFHGLISINLNWLCDLEYTLL